MRRPKKFIGLLSYSRMREDKYDRHNDEEKKTS